MWSAGLFGKVQAHVRCEERQRPSFIATKAGGTEAPRWYTSSKTKSSWPATLAYSHVASLLLLNFPCGVLLAFSQRRHCEETQIRIQLRKQLSERESGVEKPGNCIENLWEITQLNQNPNNCCLCVFLSSTGEGALRRSPSFLVFGAWCVLWSGKNFPRAVAGLGPGQPPTNTLMNNMHWPRLYQLETALVLQNECDSSCRPDVGFTSVGENNENQASSVPDKWHFRIAYLTRGDEINVGFPAL